MNERKRALLVAMLNAYLNIETTGLFRWKADISVVGIFLVKNDLQSLVQLVGKDVNSENLSDILMGVERIFTFNGTQFDLPFIHTSLGYDLDSQFEHHDLKIDCYRRNLYGDLKSIERKMGISRQLKEISRWDTIQLWRSYFEYGNRIAFDLLLQYNKEDVMNLKVLRDMITQ